MNIDGNLLETLAAAAHDGWMEGKRAAGVTSRKAEWGEEFMVPYDELSERAKELDRSQVRTTLEAVERAGMVVVLSNTVGRVQAAASRAIAGSSPRSKERQLAVTILRALGHEVLA